MTVSSEGIIMANCVVTVELGLILLKESINMCNFCVDLCSVLTTQGN